ncbi:MAG: YabP/YqfC family sporulation protein [Eisenbergiella sp.]
MYCNTRGSSELYIENYRRILEYREKSIRILTRSGRLEVCGQGLTVTSYTMDEM